MADDFARLVAAANPATRQYQRASTGYNYPPSASADASGSGSGAANRRGANDIDGAYQFHDNSPQRAGSQPHGMDPFFDDEDDGMMPDSAFGGLPIAMQSTESGLPLRGAAANPAGHSMVSFGQPGGLGPGAGPGRGGATGMGGNGQQQPQSWSFDDDVNVEQPNEAFPGPGHSSSSRGFPGGAGGKRARRQRRWRWPWQKQVELKGERVVALNDFNGEINTEFCSNYVSTSKYSLATFVPKFLFGELTRTSRSDIVTLLTCLPEQFSKYANLFFLFTALIQQIPDVSPTNQYTTIVPLGVVLLASAFKETQEDLKRHQSDSELNARKAKVLRGDLTFEDRKWRNIRVGDVVRLESDDFIPADLVLLTSSEPEGLCYIETSNLDG